MGPKDLHENLLPGDAAFLDYQIKKWAHYYNMWAKMCSLRCIERPVENMILYMLSNVTSAILAIQLEHAFLNCCSCFLSYTSQQSLWTIKHTQVTQHMQQEQRLSFPPLFVLQVTKATSVMMSSKRGLGTKC